MKKLILLCGLLIPVMVLNAQKYNLSLNLENGKTYTQVMQTLSTINQEVNGMKMEIKMEIAGKISYQVNSASDKLYDLSVKYESLSMSMDVPMKGKMTFSSENKEANDPASKILATLVGNEFQVKMTTKGEVLEVTGFDSLLTKIFEQSPEIPQSQSAQIKTQIEGAYGVESFKKNFANFAGAFPAELIQVGDKWTTENSIETMMKMKMNSTFTLVAVTEDSYQIQSESVLTTVADSISSNGMNISYDLNGKMRSELFLDKKSGWTRKANMQQDIEGFLEMGKSEKMPEGMKIPMKISTVINFTE